MVGALWVFPERFQLHQILGMHNRRAVEIHDRRAGVLAMVVVVGRAMVMRGRCQVVLGGPGTYLVESQ